MRNGWTRTPGVKGGSCGSVWTHITYGGWDLGKAFAHVKDCFASVEAEMVKDSRTTG